jgi:hypothetical protein
MLINRKLMVMVAMTVVVVSAVAFTNPPADEPGFKNLKILPKDISHEQLGKIMHEFNDALGVGCDFCHAPSKDPKEQHPDFVSDEKPEKSIARQMMKMTTKINSKYFGAKHPAIGDSTLTVTCATCHHGTPHPESRTENKEHQGPPPPPREERH